MSTVFVTVSQHCTASFSPLADASSLAVGGTVQCGSGSGAYLPAVLASPSRASFLPFILRVLLILDSCSENTR